jgi:hypothetical protein
MDRISDDDLQHLLETFARPISPTSDHIKSVLVELRERRLMDKYGLGPEDMKLDIQYPDER